MAPAATFLGPNTWNFIAVTINQNTFVETVYMNGSNASSATGSAPFSLSPNLFVIGRSGDNGRAYEGYIQNFMYFNTVLTGAQVNMLFEQTSTDLTIPTAPTSTSLSFSSPTLSLSWSGATNATSYIVQFYGLATSGTTGGRLLQIFSNVTGTSQNYSGTPTSNFCYATIIPINSVVSGPFITTSAVAIPQAPANPTNVAMGSFARQQTTISVSWTAVSGASSYTVNFLSNAANSTSGGTVWQTFTGLTGTSQTSSTTLRGGANGTYYYATVTAVSGSGSSSAVASSGTVLYHIPAWVNNNFLWLDGNDQVNSVVASGNNVTQWRDKSGSNNSTVLTSPTRPQLTTVNGLSAVTFLNNSSQSNYMYGNVPAMANISLTFIGCMTVTNVASVANPRIFMFGCNSASSTYSGALFLRPGPSQFIASYHNNILGGNTNPVGGGTNILARSTFPAYASPFVFTLKITYINASCNLVQIAVNGSNFPTTFYAGNNGTGGNGAAISNYSIANYLQVSGVANWADAGSGIYCEFLAYNTALTDAFRNQVEGYLAWKWGTTASLFASHPFKSVAP
jgi:hypothetical protein